MKKFRIFAALLLAAYMGIIPIQATLSSQSVTIASAETAAVKSNGMTFEIREDKTDELMLTSYSGKEAVLTVPETIDGIKVTGIAKGAFCGSKTIKNVTLPETIDYLESGIFADSSLETVNIPKSADIIPNDTFKDCMNLKNVELHDDIICIAKTAFENASFQPERKSNDYAENSYGYYNSNFQLGYAVLQKAVFHEGKTKNLSFPEMIDGVPVKRFDSLRFSNSCELKDGGNNITLQVYESKPYAEINSVEFPKYLDEINTNVFRNHHELKNMSIKAKSVTIKRTAFENTGIEKLVIHDPKNIGVSAFGNCKELESITFDECSGDMTIEEKAFSGCTKLNTLTISGEPETITIGNDAFKNCTSLKKIIVPDTCKKIIIGQNSFENTAVDQLPEVSSEIVIDRNAFRNAKIKEIEINSDCSIGVNAFWGCPIGSLTINSENADIKLDAFADCKDLEEVEIKGNCRLAANAFLNCTALKNINIDTSEKITGNAFNRCQNLMTINGKQVFDAKKGDFVPEYKDFIMNNFNGSDDVGFINQYVKCQVKKIVSENITPDMNDMQKVRTLHDWVCEHTKYSTADEPDYDDSKNHSDASILLNDSTVCEGYTKLCNLLYHEAGLETYYESGVNHAWNIVRIDKHYFHVDATWDDSSASYQWFCKSDSEMKEAGGDHASWKTADPSVLSVLHGFQDDLTPECLYPMGDMNADKEISVADIVKMENYLLGKEKTDDNFVLSDLNFDGNTDIFDMVEIRKKVLGNM